MSDFLISGGFIQNPGEQKQKKNVLIHNDKIMDITDDCSFDVSKNNLIEANNLLITPGLIDQHIHGGYGCDFNTSGVETILEFLLNLPKHGITSICPTIMTDTVEQINNQIKKIKQAKALLPDDVTKIIGINIEGPFLSPEYKGAHEEGLFLNPIIQNYKEFESDEIRIITIAPELDKDFELTKYLASKGVIVSAGHSNADEKEFTQATQAGLSQITHLFNAMTPIHHRNPSITGAALVNDEVYVEVIADHNHLHPDIIELIRRSKPKNKIIFISDSLPLNQSQEDSMIFGGQEIFKQDGKAINKNGNLAGSLMFMDSIIQKNLNSFEMSELLLYCSLNPAQNLKIEDLGQIKKGMTADLVIWDEKTVEIKAVFINGKLVIDNLPKKN